MNRVGVKSSNIRSIGYDKDRKLLEIEFNSGSIYEYSNVPHVIYFSLLDAPSHGKYFGKYIRNIFPTRRIC
jgi:hypothetical protein